MKIQRIIVAKTKRIRSCAVDLALEKGVIKGHEDYKKFIILGMGRTGSNMLASALRSHGQIVTYGELFNNGSHDRIFWEHPDYIPYRALDSALLLRWNDPTEFLDTIVFRRFPKKISAVGLKLFYYHAHEENWKCVWPYLRSISTLKVVHIKRRNLLRTLLSLKIASMVGKWSIQSKEIPMVPASIELEYKKCLETFQRNRELERRGDIFFQGHDKIDVIYEDLVGNFSGQMKHVQDFLEIEHRALRPSTNKQNTQALSKSISNYWELKERFEDTPWGAFFEE